MKIAHLSISPLSNVPYTWATMLNRYSKHQNMHIHSGQASWAGWKENIDITKKDPLDIERARDFISEADLLLFYGHNHPYRIELAPLDLGKVLLTKKVGYVLGVDPFLVWPRGYSFKHWFYAASSKNQIVATGDMCQGYPNATLIPICVPLEEETYQFQEQSSNNDKLHILLATTHPKGKRAHLFYEAIELLKKDHQLDIEFELITSMPHDQLMERKRRADIIFDHVADGGWGLNGLEAAALGKPVVARFAPEVVEVYKEHLGIKELPLINPNASAKHIVESVLPYARSAEKRAEMGKSLRKWVEAHWSTASRASLLEKTVEKFAND